MSGIWRDDRLFTPDGAPINPPIDPATGAPLLVGRLGAVDRDPGADRRLWFGNNRARVHGLDLQDADFAQSSPMLGATCPGGATGSPSAGSGPRLKACSVGAYTRLPCTPGQGGQADEPSCPLSPRVSGARAYPWGAGTPRGRGILPARESASFLPGIGAAFGQIWNC